MKLIEVVVLAGAHCISPVQQSGSATEVAKVQCAVVIEKDTEAGTLRIVPAGSSREPQVVAVLERLDRQKPETTIQPASAPPTAAAPPVATEKAPLTASPSQQIAAEASDVDADVAPPLAEAEAAIEPPAKPVQPAKPKKAETKKAETKKAQARKSGTGKADEKKTEAEAKTASKCLGEAKPKWYTAEDGRRKYRCVLPG
jgi:hypothetical protein